MRELHSLEAHSFACTPLEIVECACQNDFFAAAVPNDLCRDETAIVIERGVIAVIVVCGVDAQGNTRADNLLHGLGLRRRVLLPRAALYAATPDSAKTASGVVLYRSMCMSAGVGGVVYEEVWYVCDETVRVLRRRCWTTGRGLTGEGGNGNRVRWCGELWVVHDGSFTEFQSACAGWEGRVALRVRVRGRVAHGRRKNRGVVWFYVPLSDPSCKNVTCVTRRVSRKIQMCLVSGSKSRPRRAPTFAPMR